MASKSESVAKIFYSQGVEGGVENIRQDHVRIVLTKNDIPAVWQLQQNNLGLCMPLKERYRR